MAPAQVELDDGCLDQVDRADVRVVGHDGMEYAGNVLFGTLELLREEYGLVCKVGVDRERPAIDRDLSCTKVSVEREWRGRTRTRLKVALFLGRGLADVPEVAETRLVQDEVVEEVLLAVPACGEGGGEDGPERGDGVHWRTKRARTGSYRLPCLHLSHGTKHKY